MAGERTRMLNLCDSIVASVDEMRKEIDAAWPLPPDPALNVIKVALGESVQNALTSLLQTGGIIKLAPGKHNGELKFPERPEGSKLITFTSDSTNLPAPGQRMTPEYAEALGTIASVNTSTPTLFAQNKSRGFAFVNVGIGGPKTFSNTIIALGGDKNGMPTPDLRPDGFSFDRIFAYGDPVNGARRGLQPNAMNVQLINSYIKDCMNVGRDSQAVGAWNGCQNLLVKNCYLEGGAENVMFGGSDSASVEMTSQDIVIDGCTLAKVYNDAWKAASIKCLLEVKNVKRLLVKNCLLENNWVRDWSTGVAMMLKACNGENIETWATCEDVTLENLIIRNVGSVFGIIGKNDSGRVSDWMRRVKIHNVLAYNINVAPWLGTGRGCEIANGAEDYFEMDHITYHTNAHSWMNFRTDSGITISPGRLVMKNSVVAESSYGYRSETYGMGFPNIPKDWTGNNEVAGNVFKIGTRPQGTVPPNNLRLVPADWDASFNAKHGIIPGSPASAVPTTDGTLPGADVAALETLVGVTI
jgi:hypothetical protein